MAPRDGHHNRILNFHSSNQSRIGSTSFTHSITQAKRVGNDEAVRLRGDWVQRIILHTLKGKKERKYPNHCDSAACNYVCVCFKIMPPKFFQNNHLATWRLCTETPVWAITAWCPLSALEILSDSFISITAMQVAGSSTCQLAPHVSQCLTTAARNWIFVDTNAGKTIPSQAAAAQGQLCLLPTAREKMGGQEERGRRTREAWAGAWSGNA